MGGAIIMIHKIINFTWDEWKWMAVIVMLGVVMYWTAIVIEPTYQLLQETAEIQEGIEKRAIQSVEQNAMLIENQNNNTKKLENIIANQTKIMDNQLVLVKQLGGYGATISNQSQLLLLQGEDIEQILGFFRENFNETFLAGESIDRQNTEQILGNVTIMKEAIENLRSSVTP